jgi:pyruvate dehydrogenase E2 component (dihydrolipoamide acetyltransferase)
MPIEIKMPKLTDTMTDGTLVKWLKKENDKIGPGDLIAEVETDKATQELETFDAGTIAKIFIPEGGKVTIGAVMAVIAIPGEDVAAIRAAATGGNGTPAAPAPKETPKAAPPARAPGIDEGLEKPAAQPKVAAPPKPVFEPAPVAVAVVDHPEGGEQIHRVGKMRVSPLARKIADDRGVDLTLVEGTGPDGRIIKRDVLDAASRPQRVAPAARAQSNGPATPAAKLESKKIPLSNMRQTIAKRLLIAKQTIPHFYVSIDIVMDKLIELRLAANEHFKPEKLTVTDFIARAVAVALTRVPQMNASFAETEIIQHGSVELGIAVALDDGLMVPVIRSAHTKNVREISNEIKTLSAGAKANKLKLNQITGSTFTISNLGMYGIKDFMAIVNPPEGAILAVGGTEARPIVRNNQVVPAQVMTVTLSADHRVVDGATGAKFLAELKTILENPLVMIM